MSQFIAIIEDDKLPVEATVYGDSIEDAYQNALDSFANVLDVYEV